MVLLYYIPTSSSSSLSLSLSFFRSHSLLSIHLSLSEIRFAARFSLPWKSYEIFEIASDHVSSQVNESTMTTSAVKPGVLISLQDLNPSSPLFKQGSSLRRTGNLQEYSAETAIALIVDGCYKVKIDTQHLRDLTFRVGSIYQFIGELLIQPDNEAVLQARVGRNVDGIDLKLYYKSLQLLTQFQSEHMNDD